MIGPSLRAGARRALGEPAVALLLAAPTALALPLFAVPVYRALADGLPADRDLLGGLDGAAAVDLLNRAWPEHGEALLVAGVGGAGVWAAGGFLLTAAAARALARGRRRVGAARLLATLGEGIGPLVGLLAVAAVAHLLAYGLVRAIDGFLALGARSASTDAAAGVFTGLRLGVAVAFFLLVRCWCRLAVAVSARERPRSPVEAFARAAFLAVTRPSIAAVDLAAAAAGVALAALAAVPRWLLPQEGWATVTLGLVLAQAPVLARAFGRTGAIAATLEALEAAAAPRGEAAGGTAPGQASPAG